MSKTCASVLALAGTLLLAACGSSSDTTGDARDSVINAKPCARDTSPAVQGMPDTERIYGWIEDLVNIGYRRTGTPAGEKAAAYVKCQFEALGLEDVHYETAKSWNWSATRSSLHVNGQAVDSFPVAHSYVTLDEPSVFSTGPDGLNAEIVELGSGVPVRSVKGKIAMFDLKFQVPPLLLALQIEFLWDPTLSTLEPTLVLGNPFLTSYSSSVEQLMEDGAVGFIGVLSDYFDSNKYYNEFYRRTQVTVPGVWVTKKDGARIREMMKSGTGNAKMVMEGSRKEAIGRAVVGFLPGKSKDTIMVQSHHDSVFFGAVEDGSGTASVFAQAQYFASQPPESRQKTLMFATFDTHFSGYQVHREFTRKYVIDKETPYNIVANVTIEHIGKQGIKGADDKLEITDKPELRAVMENLGPTLKLSMINSIIKHDLRRTALISAHLLCPLGGLPTDASFICSAGVPTASLIAGPNYLYDLADTLDKVAKDDLVPVANVFAELIEAIDATPTPLIGLPIKSPLYESASQD